MTQAPAIPDGNFLCFQLKHIGDFLHTLPALGFLRTNRLGASVEAVVTPKIAALAESHPWVDRVHVLDRDKRAGGLRRLTTRISRRKYAATFIFDGQTRSIVAASLAGLRRRIGSSGLYPLGGFARLYSRNINIVDSRYRLESQAYRSQKMTALALGLTPGPALRPPPPHLPPSALETAGKLLAELPGAGPIIGLTLAGLQYEKSWPLSHFAHLCRLLRRDFAARLFVTGGPGESEMARRLAEASGEPVADFCGRTGLLDMIALAGCSDLFITVDTGTAHLAALTETPLISIYQWTSPALWPPQSPRARLMCYNWALSRFELPSEGGPWLAAPVITPEMVFREAAAVLSVRPGAGSNTANSDEAENFHRSK